MNRSSVKKSELRLPSVLLTGILILICAQGHAGISQPPVLIYGKLAEAGGALIYSGQLRFTFSPTQGGTPLVIDGEIERFSPETNLLLRVPVESSPVSNAADVLALQRNYVVSAEYNGIPLDIAGMPIPFRPASSSLVGPVSMTVEANTPVLSVSAEVDFGSVLKGEYVDRSVRVSNDGTNTLTGAAWIETRQHFRLIEGGVTVSIVQFDLQADEMLDLSVRFQPVSPGIGFLDVLIVETNAGRVERLLSGDGLVVPFTPTATATETLTPLYSYTPSPTSTETLSPTPTVTETPSPTSTALPTLTLTSTEVPTETPTLSATATTTETPSQTPIMTDTPTETPSETSTPTATATPPQLDQNCDGFIAAEDMQLILRAWHGKETVQPDPDLNEDGLIDYNDLLIMSRYWIPPQVISTVEIVDITQPEQIRLIGQLPGENYCSVGVEDVTLRIDEEGEIPDIPLQNEEDKYFLNVHYSFSLQSCGCGGDSKASRKLVLPRGEDTPIDLTVELPEGLNAGQYRVMVFANGSLQTAETAFAIADMQ